MNKNYNQNYTKEEISAILAKIKDCIKNDRFTISLNENRQENINFIREYNIRSDIQKNILLNIEVEDFCHSLKNKKRGYEYETLYVFAPRVKLSHVGKCEMVNISRSLISLLFLSKIEQLLFHFIKQINR